MNNDNYTEEFIKEHLKNDNKGFRTAQKFLLSDKSALENYKKYLSKKYLRYKEEVNIIDEFIFKENQIKIKNIEIESRGEYSIKLKINNDFKIEFTITDIIISLNKLKNFSLVIKSYNLKTNKFELKINVKNKNKSNYEIEDNISSFIEKKIMEDQKSLKLISDFIITIDNVQNIISELVKEDLINPLLHKDLLNNFKSEELEIYMITNDFDINNTIEKIKKTIKSLEDNKIVNKIRKK